MCSSSNIFLDFLCVLHVNVAITETLSLNIFIKIACKRVGTAQFDVIYSLINFSSILNLIRMLPFQLHVNVSNSKVIQIGLVRDVAGRFLFVPDRLNVYDNANHISFVGCSLDV